MRYFKVSRRCDQRFSRRFSLFFSTWKYCFIEPLQQVGEGRYLPVPMLVNYTINYFPITSLRNAMVPE